MLVNTLEFSPVPLRGITGAPRYTLEHESWWNEQRKRCIEGYTVGDTRITGFHYWYLNFWKIRGINRFFNPGQRQKRLVSPRFLELDYDFFNEFEKAKDIGKNFSVAKKRQCGFSEKAGAIVGHEFTFFPASQSIIVAGEEKYAKNTMTFVHRGLNALKGTEFFKRKTGGQEEVTARYQAYDEDGRPYWKGYMSEIHMLTAKTNAEVVSRFSPSLIVFEETGRFKLLLDTFRFVKPSLQTEGIKTGMAFFLGTGGDMDEGVEGSSKLFFNPSQYDVMEYENVYSEDPDKKKIAYFVPGWRFHTVDENGNDLVEESKKKMQDARINAAKSEDPADLIKEVIANPENPDEIYMIFEGNRFNAMKLNTQRAKILKSRALEHVVTRGNLDWIYDDIPAPGRPHGNIIGIDWQVDMQNGTFEVIDPPQRDEEGYVIKQYYGGTDSYDQDDAPTSNSMGSTSIFNGRLQSFVARLTQRPPTAAEFYENSAKLCYWYDCRNLIEFSKIGIFGWYERAGLLWLLKERPKVVYANVQNSKAANKWGVDPSSKEFWISSYRDYIEKYYENMYDLTQISKALEYKDDKNCDITISSSLAYVHYLDEIEYREEPTTQKEVQQLVYYKLVNGIMREFYKPLNQEAA